MKEFQIKLAGKYIEELFKDLLLNTRLLNNNFKYLYF